jgi:hypothetical protein
LALRPVQSPVRAQREGRGGEKRWSVQPNSRRAHSGQYGTTSGGEATYIRQRSLGSFHARWHSWHSMGRTTMVVPRPEATASCVRSWLMGPSSAITRACFSTEGLVLPGRSPSYAPFSLASPGLIAQCWLSFPGRRDGASALGLSAQVDSIAREACRPWLGRP